MPLFAFTVFSFDIENTRSAHEDTDYVSWRDDSHPDRGPRDAANKIKSMGNINNGTHLVDLSFGNPWKRFDPG